jgi:hypothetical protein
MKSSRIRQAGHVAREGKKTNAYKFLVRNTEGKLRPRRPRRRKEDDIKMGVKGLWHMPWRSWLKHCATSQKVVGSIPDKVILIFQWHNPSSRPMALRSTQLLAEMSIMGMFWWVKAAVALGCNLVNFKCRLYKNSGSLNLLVTSGPLQRQFAGSFIHCTVCCKRTQRISWFLKNHGAQCK